MDDLQSLTVLELKEILRGQGKKISGTKKELILRLKKDVEEKYLSLDDGSTPVEETESNSALKKQIPCKKCFQILNIPEDYEGKVECPKCQHSFIRILPHPLKLDSLLRPLLFLTIAAFVAAILSFMASWSFDNGVPYGGYGFALVTFVSMAVGCFFGLLSLILIFLESQNKSRSRS